MFSIFKFKLFVLENWRTAVELDAAKNTEDDDIIKNYELFSAPTNIVEEVISTNQIIIFNKK